MTSDVVEINRELLLKIIDAINDAIYEEDGLDGAIGEDILRRIRTALSPQPNAFSLPGADTGGQPTTISMPGAGGYVFKVGELTGPHTAHNGAAFDLVVKVGTVDEEDDEKHTFLEWTATTEKPAITGVEDVPASPKQSDSLLDSIKDTVAHSLDGGKVHER